MARLRRLPDRLLTIFRSIRFRLALWFVLILGIVVVSFSAFIYTRQKQELEAAAYRRLEFRVRRLDGFPGPPGREIFERPAGQLVTGSPGEAAFLQEGDEVVLLTSDGQVVQSWGTLDTDEVTQMVSASIQQGINNTSSTPLNPITTIDLPADKGRDQYALMFLPVSIDGRLGGFFMVASPIDPDNQLQRMAISLIVGISITLGIALVGGVWLADRAMRPVKTITQAAQTIGETDLNRRLHLNRKDELGELADTFDGMLARLQAAFERQRQFTADASHELRTPLTIVELEASRVLAAQHSPDEYQGALAVIYSENQLMIRLVNNLLTLARMDAGQVVLQKEELDLSDVTLEVLERLTPLAAKEQVQLAAGELPELPVLADRQYLVQMLTNLVENAIKYTSGENKLVQIETGSRSIQNRLQAWVRVIDNGPGISSEHLVHLFDRFYQVDAARTRQESDYEVTGDQAPSGTGLGLSIARWIAQAHGGGISVQSEPGNGSIFEVSLPMISPAGMMK